MAVEQAIRPFSNGCQYMDWDLGNCATCERDPEVCEIAVALLCAGFGDGAVTADIAQRMGYTDYGWQDGLPCYGWPCLEHDPPFDNIEEWANES